VEVSDPTQSRGKLALNWEGPYRVTNTSREGTYTLLNIEGKQLPRMPCPPNYITFERATLS
ncbi:hypothetical protein BHE74_00052558, partial [Ensete ventricosum]